MSYTPPPTTTLTLTRTVSAPPEAIWDVWMDPTSPGGPWFGSARVVLDPKVDGLFYSLILHEGRDWAHYGRFVTLERPRRIAYTWVSEGTRGLESVVSLELVPEGGRTRVVLTHTGVPDDAFGRQHGDGWAYVLGAIAERFYDRDLTVTRHLHATVAQVRDAIVDPVRLARWWGPDGFRNEFEVCEPHPGGAWVFDMIGPDGKRYPNESRFIVVDADRIVIEHVCAPHFTLEIKLTPERDGTRLEWRGTFPDAKLAAQIAAFVGPANEQNVDRLEAELAR